jgi:hypothetical protein
MYNDSGIYPVNTFDHWTNQSLSAFTSIGLNITSAIGGASGGQANLRISTLTTIDAILGDVINITGTLTLNSGTAPILRVLENATFTDITLVSGVNTITYTCTANCTIQIIIYTTTSTNFSFTGVSVTSTATGNINSYFADLPTFAHDYFMYNGTTLNNLLPVGEYYLKITMDNGKVYYSEWFIVDCVFGSDEGLPPTTTFSTKYLIINFFNSCNLGNILYNGFVQTLYFESETMESTYPTEEEGQKNGEGRFVRTFARQVKKYIARTKQMPDYMVDVFNRMKLHDNIELIDTVGDTHNLLNLEVDHEWLFDDKYYAKIDLTFDYDESVLVSACCENVNQPSSTIDSGDITIDQM